MSPLLGAVFLAAFVTLFGLILVIGSSFLGPKTPHSKVKQAAYECGIEVKDSDRSKIPVKFYLTAILFILFDIEIIFLYPWAVAYGDYVNEGMGWYIFSAMFVFVLIFIFGLVWEIKSKALEWE